MKNNLIKILFVFVFVFSNTAVNAQEIEATNLKIAKYFSDYYELERENIHLQLNKTVFLNNERIWFKGYVFNRKEEVPFYDTTNVFAVLYDNDGTQIDFKLLLGFNGSFTGFFELGETLKSGKYKIHIFTNWMNNFIENESTTTEITIINKSDSNYSIKNRLNYSKVNIDFQPEGDNFIRDKNNIVGFKVSDCNGNAIPNITGSIIDETGTVTHSIETNDFGMGKFEITPTEKPSKAVFTYFDKKFEAALPNPSLTGIALEVNNIDFDDKVTINLNINGISTQFSNNQPVFIVINQEEKINILNASFKDGKKEININYKKKLLFDGVNIIRVLDKDLKQIAERIIYNNSNLISEKINFEDIAKSKNKYIVNAKSGFKKSNLSISIVPENSIALDTDFDIFNSLKIKPYLNSNKIVRKEFLDADNNWNAIDLDLALLNHKNSSANWEDITSNPPKKAHSFDVGLDVRGVVVNDIKPEKYKVKLFSIFANLNSMSDITAKKEFSFKNLILKDSTALSLSLEDIENSKNIDLTYLASISNNKRQFLRKINFATPIVCENSDNNKTSIIELPKIIDKTLVELDEVKILSNKKKLTRDAVSGNMMLRGYKMDFYGKGYNYLLDFVLTKGFTSTRNQGNLIVYTNEIGSNKEPRSPAIFFDDQLIFDYNEMSQVSIEDIDEIYVDNKRTNGGGQNTIGIIKVYFKKDAKTNNNSKEKPFKIYSGFAKNVDFKNNDYASTNDKGFENFGIINWIPQIVTDENGNFKFEIPDIGRTTVKIKIEGLSDDGKLISEIKTLKLN